MYLHNTDDSNDLNSKFGYSTKQNVHIYVQSSSLPKCKQMSQNTTILCTIYHSKT